MKLIPSASAVLLLQIVPRPVAERLLLSPELENGTDCAVFDATHINSAHDYLFTPLHYAALAGSAALVDFLIEAGADVHAATAKQDTACHLAAAKGHDDVLRSLHRAGADLNRANLCTYTPVHMATYGEHVSTLRLLHSCGADMHCKADGMTALHIAVPTGNRNLVEFLTSPAVGLDVNLAAGNGWTPVLSAAYSGLTEVVALLHSRGADLRHVTFDGLQAAHFAAAFEHMDLLKVLVEAGVDIECSDDEGATPLAHAAVNGCLEAAKYLVLSCGASTDTTDVAGRSPAHVAAKNGHTGFLQFLLTWDTSRSRLVLHQRTVDGLLPYHVAKGKQVLRSFHRLNGDNDDDTGVECL